MRAVIHARYSSDLQSTSSIEDQLRLCRARIEAEGWLLVNTYTDHKGVARRRNVEGRIRGDGAGWRSDTAWHKQGMH